MTSQEGVSLKDVLPLGGYEKRQPKMAAGRTQTTVVFLKMKLQHPGCVGIFDD